MNTPTQKCLTWSLAAALLLFGFVGRSQRAEACPFCAAVALTFSEEIGNSQVAVIAKLTYLPPRAESDAAAANFEEIPKAKFEITKVLKGESDLGDTRGIETVYFGDGQVGAKFLVMGIDPPMLNWSTPIAISDRGEQYIAEVLALPTDEGDRLAFFQDYLEDSDELLARDAYDEFAKTPYSGVLALKDRMNHDKLVEWIQSPKIPVSRRRLYLTMLGVCGTEDDMPMLEELIKSKDRQTRGALDALVAAYLTLKGPDGMPLVEDLFLKDKDAEYTDTYATIMALRFHGTEEKIIPRERLLEGIRLMLDRPQLADLVIPDLARWEDWSVMDRLVELFKTSDDESSWVRVPVVNYLRACPLPEAKKRLEELAKLDPDTVKRANSFFPFAGTPAAAAVPSKDDDSQDDDSTPKPPTPVAVDTDAKPAAATAAPATAEKQPANETKPTLEAEKADATEQEESKPAPTTGAATSTDRETKVAAASALTRSFAKDAAPTPVPPASTLGVFVGLASAAVFLSGAFWAILLGGRPSA
jgi:hypothetical protein